jgi:glutamate/tyrosine decarboxylase-like PLP-dependent enzyme
VPADALLATMQGYRGGDADWKTGRTWSLVYYGGEDHHEVLRRASEMFLAENLLNPMAFKSLRRMEAEVVEMTASMLNGPPECVGTMTSGGTESLLMACKAARDRARSKKPWILRPEIVAPETIHPAFDKAAHYFGLRLRKVKVGKDFRVDPKKMRRAIGASTVLLAASAPQYPHGVVDPIPELGAIAQDKGVPFHVDACVGGFVLPFVEALGYPLPVFDFRVPGVTSMSADLHKYGLAAKGASVVLYRSMDYMKHQFFVATDFPGGIYASPTIAGTRPGGPVAAAWAAMTFQGMAGYVDHTRRAMEATEKLVAGVRAIEGLHVLGEPHATIVAWASRDASVDTFAVADFLADRGWNIDRQHRPASIHCTVTSNESSVMSTLPSPALAAETWSKTMRFEL